MPLETFNNPYNNNKNPEHIIQKGEMLWNVCKKLGLQPSTQTEVIWRRKNETLNITLASKEFRKLPIGAKVKIENGKIFVEDPELKSNEIISTYQPIYPKISPESKRLEYIQKQTADRIIDKGYEKADQLNLGLNEIKGKERLPQAEIEEKLNKIRQNLRDEIELMNYDFNGLLKNEVTTRNNFIEDVINILRKKEIYDIPTNFLQNYVDEFQEKKANINFGKRGANKKIIENVFEGLYKFRPEMKRNLSYSPNIDEALQQVTNDLKKIEDKNSPKKLHLKNPKAKYLHRFKNGLEKIKGYQKHGHDPVAYLSHGYSGLSLMHYEFTPEVLDYLSALPFKERAEVCLIYPKYDVDSETIKKLPPDTIEFETSAKSLENGGAAAIPKNVKRIIIGYGDATPSPEALRNLPPNIENLQLTSCKNITDEHIRALPRKITELWLGDSPNITDSGIKYLPKNLVRLSLRESKCTDKITNYFSNKLVYLDIRRSPNLTDEFIKSLPKSIGRLNLDDCPLLTQSSIDWWKGNSKPGAELL